MRTSQFQSDNSLFENETRRTVQDRTGRRGLKGGSRTGFANHGGDESRDNGATFPHLRLLAVRHVRNDPDDPFAGRRLAGISHDQHLDDVVVDVPASGVVAFQGR